MNLLLDTHTFLWFINGSPDLSKNARAIIENTENSKLVSIATFWEIAIKISIGKLRVEMPFEELAQHVYKNGFEILPLTFHHTNQLLALPLHHKDPFDRIIISQAICEEFLVVSRDPSFYEYNVKIEW